MVVKGRGKAWGKVQAMDWRMDLQTVPKKDLCWIFETAQEMVRVMGLD